MPNYTPLHPDLPNGSVFNRDHLAYLEGALGQAWDRAQEALDGVAAGVSQATLNTTKAQAVAEAKTYTDTLESANRTAWANADTTVLATATTRANTAESNAKEHADTVAAAEVAATGYEQAADNDTYAWSVRDAQGRVSELVLGRDGQVPAWVLDRWAQRLPVEIPESVAPVDVWRRSLLVDEYKRRRGHVIGTGGKPAVALRFDHGLKNFRDIVLPLLDKYQLPSMQTMNSRAIDSTLNAPVTWAECLDWWANHGVEFTNHTATHGSQEGRANAYDEIVNGLAELKAHFGGQYPIEMFCPAGGVTVGEKALFDGGKTPESFYNTYYGQLVMQHHAATQGYIGGAHRPLPADMDIGLTIVGMDSNTAAGLKGSVDEAIRLGSAVQFMGHPSEIDKAGGYITTAQYEEFFAYLAEKRAAGELEVLSSTGLILADPTTTHRHDFLAPHTWGNGFTGWSGATGWSTTTGPDGGTWATTTTGTQLSRALALNTNHKHHRGGNRELAYEVVAPAGAVVETTATGSSGVINAVRTHTIPATDTPITVRLHCALPLVSSPTVTVKIGRVSGGAVTISAPRFITV